MLHINLDDMNIFQRQTNKYYLYKVGSKVKKFNFNIHFAWRGVRHDSTILEEQVAEKSAVGENGCEVCREMILLLYVLD